MAPSPPADGAASAGRGALNFPINFSKWNCVLNQHLAYVS